MTKSTITRERIEQYANDPRMCNINDEIRELARMALAAMDSSESVELPLDYLQGYKDGLEWASQLAEANHPETGEWLYDDPIELAKAIRKGPDMPPVQPVADSEPDRNPVLAYADSYRDMAKQGVESVPIWSVITDLERNIAPLYRHAQPAPERDQVRIAHAEWSQATFGNVGPVGPLKHLSKEALEAATEPGDLSEWADMQFLLWDAQRRAGITDEQITKAMIEKLEVNKQREWPEPKDGEPRLHIKEQPAPVVTETAHSSAIAEQLAHVLSGLKVTDHQRAVICCAVDRLNNVAQLLQLSPYALLVPEILDYQGAKELYNYLMTEEEINATVNAWNACRSAMLNGGKS